MPSKPMREVDEDEALIVHDADGDELWIYKSGDKLGIGAVGKADDAIGFAAVLTEDQARETMRKLAIMFNRVFGGSNA